MNILQEIFSDHYEAFLDKYHPRDAIVENIEKMVHCGDPSRGGAVYGCPDCGEIKFVPFRCHSRFCPTCGNKYALERCTAMSFKLVNCVHRHCVFTIPQQLRIFFLKDRSLLNCLFDAVNSVLSLMFRRLSKKEDFTPGFVCVLHTFGRSLQWNPHIHCVVSEGATGLHTAWRKVNHFNYTFLRKAFMTALLNKLHKRIGDSFKATKSYIYRYCLEGFYIYAKPRKCDPKTVSAYIGRYLGRPVIATSRIDRYDDGKWVTFHYNRHEDDVRVPEVLPVMDFMKRLCQHIPEKHFKMIRYYGIYARHRVEDKDFIKAIPSEKRNYYRSLLKWRYAILNAFDVDPLKCPRCHGEMIFIELRYKHQRISLEDLYYELMDGQWPNHFDASG